MVPGFQALEGWNVLWPVLLQCHGRITTSRTHELGWLLSECHGTHLAPSTTW